MGQTVTKWRRRFANGRLAGLSDAPRTGQPRRHGDERVQAVLDATLNRRPGNATHWSVRSLSAELGVPRDFVHRVWRAFGLKPHLSHSFKLSSDPHFVAQVQDVVGLHLDPPDRALVLFDEKSQIQALERTQPSLPLNWGTPETRTHKTAKVKQWLLRHPRFHCHFTPTYSSWIDLVERFFASLTEHHLRRGSHRSIVALERAIRGYLETHNEHSTPFRWTKSADEIIESVNSAPQIIDRTVPSSGGAVLLGETDQLELESLASEDSQQRLGVIGWRRHFTAENRFDLRASLAHDIEQQLEQQLDDLGRVGRPARRLDVVGCG